MKNVMLKIICLSTVCITGMAYAAPDPLEARYTKVCKGKKEGQPISFAHKGVLFNGTCVAGEKGLVFQPPLPPSGGEDTQTQGSLSETRSEPRPVSAPYPAAPEQQPPQQYDIQAAPQPPAPPSSIE